jgi:hypothetical protein
MSQAKFTTHSGAPSHPTQRTEYVAKPVTLPSLIVMENDEQMI